MAIIVEDGTIVADANSYASVQSFKDYHDARGQSYGTSTDTQIEQALVQATDYVDTRWGTRFLGQRVTSDQSLEWPRLYVFDELGTPIEGIPTKLKYAVNEFALVALTSGSLWVTPSTDASGLRVSKTSKVVGPIEVSTEYQDGVATTRKAIPAGDGLLRSLINRSGNLVRA